MEEVVITGMGIVSPIGIGPDEVWASIEAGRSGIRRIDDVAEAGWIAPFGGKVDGFDAKAFVKPRKSLKVMADEIQYAFAAGEQAWESAGLDSAEPDPERVGVVCGAGLLYCYREELADPYRNSLDEAGEFDINKWGQQGMREMYPLWLLKYLPNMSACHIGIRRDARGPTNTIAHGDCSSLMALGEAADVIRRGDADVMVTGGSSCRMHMTDPQWHAGAAFWQTGEDPATACRPFDASRLGPVCSEGAAMLVLESRRHAERRGVRPLASVLSVVSRGEPALQSGKFTGKSIEHALNAALEQAQIEHSQVGSVNAHGLGTIEDDRAEAEALSRVLGDVPAVATKSYHGNLGAASGTLELCVSLLGLAAGVVPATLNYNTPDAACPVNVSASPRPHAGDLLLALNYNTTGQAVATVLKRA